MRTSLGFTRTYFNYPFFDIKIAEVGVESGCHAVEFLTEWPEITACHLIDTWEDEQIYKRVEKIMQPWRDKVTLHRCSSIEGVTKFNDEYFDFIYIDADHRYEAVKFDIAYWYNKVKVRGVIAGHDYNLPGVQAAVTEILTPKGHVNVDFPKPSMDWWMIKERSVKHDEQ
jgi:predicted O-methyltransferase YrrM